MEQPLDQERRLAGKFLFMGEGTHGTFVVLSRQANKTLSTLLNQLSLGSLLLFNTIKPSKKIVTISEEQMVAVRELRLLLDAQAQLTFDLSTDLGDVIALQPHQSKTRKEASKTATKFCHIIETLVQSATNSENWTMSYDSQKWMSREEQEEVARATALKASKVSLEVKLPLSKPLGRKKQPLRI